jgi:tRNA nucleotidyltransferase (CCA-adding enzyme)
MKVYLVGGAVRDRLMNYPVKERDWVVVGATPEAMIKQGYQKVGRDFPVFLHPNTREEYALARTERKTAPGYYGFECDASDQVTLEDDLKRRDLTMNAIAMDEQGTIIDPYHGVTDIQEKRLRHVSEAFIEDPVRVLRVARFAARYHHLGFRLAPETRALMYGMVKRGELAHLVAERVWQEWCRSLEERNPEVFISTLRSCGALAVVLPELDRLFGVPNPPQHHPEIDSGVHTLLVLQAAVALTRDPMVRFAALVHDLGKAVTPMTRWPSHHGHEEAGVALIDALCQRLRVPVEYRNLAATVSRYHLIIHKFFDLRAVTMLKVLEQTDAFRRPHLFDKLLIACEADAKGRGRDIVYHQAQLWQNVRNECTKIAASDLIQQGFQGVAIKHELHKRRTAAIKQLLTSWKRDEKQH